MCTMSKMNLIKLQNAPKAQRRQMTAMGSGRRALVVTAGIRARPIASLGLHYPVHFTPTKSADQTLCHKAWRT